MSFLQRLSIKKQHFILIAVPACGLMILGFSLAYESLTKARASQKDEALVKTVSAVTVDIMELIAELQVERNLAIQKLMPPEMADQDPTQYKAQFPNTDRARQNLSNTISLLDDYDQPSALEAVEFLQLWIEDSPKYSVSGNGSQEPSALSRERRMFANTEALSQSKDGRRTPQALRWYRRQIGGLYTTTEKLVDLIQSAKMKELVRGYLSLSKAIEELDAQNSLATAMLTRGEYKFWESVELNFATARMITHSTDYTKFAPRELQAEYDLTFTPEQDSAYKLAKVAIEGVAVNRVEPNITLAGWDAAVGPYIQKYKATLDRYGSDMLTLAAANSSNDMDEFYFACLIVVIVFVASYAASKLIGRNIEKSLTGVADNLASSSNSVGQSSASASEASNGLSKDASDFAAALEEVSSTLEELSSMVDNSNQHAAEVKEKTTNAESTVNESLENVKSLENAMQDLDDSSNKISSIIKTIEEIAFQTNILALNAAVEAARAGEAGAGFAVVADEVRALAQRASKAAAETSDIISHSKEVARSGNDMTQRVVENFAEISEQVQFIAHAGDSIARSVDEQTTGIHQINTAIHQHSDMAQHLASVAHNMIENSNSMNTEVGSMNHNVNTLTALLGNKRSQSNGLHISGPN